MANAYSDDSSGFGPPARARNQMRAWPVRLVQLTHSIFIQRMLCCSALLSPSQS
jgi:hypothetical protein